MFLFFSSTKAFVRVTVMKSESVELFSTIVGREEGLALSAKYDIFPTSSHFITDNIIYLDTFLFLNNLTDL